MGGCLCAAVELSPPNKKWRAETVPAHTSLSQPAVSVLSSSTQQSAASEKVNKTL